MLFVILITIISSFIVTWMSLVSLVPYLRKTLLDLPNTRSSHLSPTPRGGGASFVLISLAACIFSACLTHLSGSDNPTIIFAPLLSAPIAIVGFLDDSYGLSPRVRFAFQFFTAILIIVFSKFTLTFVYIPFISLLLLGIIAVINFSNFLDGLDGLLAGCMTTMIATASVFLSAPWSTWAIVGSLLGFLLWNWSPAKVFMGDVGSTFLGSVFAILVLQAGSWYDSLSLFLLGTPLWADASFCVLRRLFAGQRVFQAHRLHLFQRLHQAGWSHSKVSLTYIAATTSLSFALLAGGLPWVVFLAVVECCVAAWLDQRVAIPFVLASKS